MSMSATELIGSKQKRSLRQLTAMITILSIAYRADRHYDMSIGTTFQQLIDSLREIINARCNRQFLFLKEILRSLLTIIHNLACRLQPIDMIGAEGEEDNARPSVFKRGEPPLHGMEYRSGVIHHTIRIDRDREMLLGKAMPYTVGKARAHKEQLFERLYLEVGARNIYYCTEVHKS